MAGVTDTGVVASTAEIVTEIKAFIAEYSDKSEFSDIIFRHFSFWVWCGRR